MTRPFELNLSRAELGDIIEALTQACEYFDNRADCDCDQDGFVPNREMRLMQLCESALEVLPDLNKRQAVLDDYREECKADAERTGERS